MIYVDFDRIRIDRFWSCNGKFSDIWTNALNNELLQKQNIEDFEETIKLSMHQKIL